MTVEVRLIILGLAALVEFGCWFNSFVARLERLGSDRGYTAFLVVAGVAFTIVVYSLMVWNMRDILLLVLCFGASGFPMILGSVQRFNEARHKTERRKRAKVEDVLND